MKTIRIDCSPEQIEIIADHLIENKELGLLPDERIWMISQARKKFPNCKILSADLDVSAAEWILSIDF